MDFPEQQKVENYFFLKLEIVKDKELTLRKSCKSLETDLS